MNAETLYKLAIQKFEENKPEEANRYLEEAVQSHEMYDTLYYWKRVELAGDWRHGEDSKQPIQDLTSVIELSVAQIIDALGKRALWSSHQGFDEDVVRDLDWAIALGDKSPSTFMWRASYRAKSGQFIGAIEDCTSAYTLLENYYDCLMVRGRYYYLAKMYDEAIEDFNFLLRLDLKTLRSAVYATAVLRLLGKAFYKKGDHEKALKAFQEMALYQDDGPYPSLQDYQVDLDD